MRCGILTTGDRPQYLGPLRRVLEPTVDEVVLFVDKNRRGHTWNYLRAMRSMLGSAGKGEPVLVCADDVITVPDWVERWDAIRRRTNASIYCLATRRRHLFTPVNLQRGYFYGCVARGFYDWATVFVDQQDLVPKVVDWYENGPGRTNETLAKRFRGVRWRHADVVFQEYLIAHRIPWVSATPCLFDHVGDVSTLNHSIGRCPMYVGNV